MASVPTSGLDLAQIPTAGHKAKTNILVVSSVALAFITFWRAAAIVLCDLASTAYYIGGISEQAIGKAAPWFILGVMLFSYAVRAVYVESCTMFTRGGVYRVVKEAMGGSLAKLSVSALMFDYVLTGPISAVAAGQYIVGLFVDMINLWNLHRGHTLINVGSESVKSTMNMITVVISILITLWFWWTNIKGIHESSDQALKIMKLTTVMGVLIIGWSVLTLCLHPSPMKNIPSSPVFTAESSGWLTGMPTLIGKLGILIAFGHTLLAMSGEESLAQVNREIEAPKLKNLLRAGFVIFLYSLLLTSLISFFAVMVIPDGKRVATYIVPDGSSHGDNSAQVDYLRHAPLPNGKTLEPGQSWGYLLQDATADYPKVAQDQVLLVGPGTNTHVERDDGGYRDNLINGLVQYLAGPKWLKIIMECFVVTVGFLILAGGVNTSIVGSNGVMNRLAEDGVLTPWFLHPQKKYGTTHRLINLVVILQLIVIVASWGDVDALGEAYAFGVIWSFVFKTLAMVVLRFKDKSPRAYEVPLNIRIKRQDAPIIPAHRIPLPAGDGVSRLVNEPPNMAVPADGEAPKPAINQGTIAALAHQQNQLDLPIGIILIFLLLLSTALINLATKKTATKWGICFTAAFLAAFIILEYISHRKHKGKHEHLEQFNEKSSDKVTAAAMGLTHADPVLVAIRGPKSMPVLERVLEEIDTDKRDIVVMTCKVLKPRTTGITPEEISVDNDDRNLLTQVVNVAEHVGKQVHPLVLPTNNPLYGIATAARDLKASEVVLGVSEAMHAEMQLEQFAMAWGTATTEPGQAAQPLTVRILGPSIELKSTMD